MNPIPFGNLQRHCFAIQKDIQQAIQEVLESGWFILGKKGEAFEQEFANYLGAYATIGVGSGTDAIEICLRALTIGPGDEVITAANTCVPTVTAISSVHARVVLTDIHRDSFTMDPNDLAKRITKKTKAIIPVHLYGQAADLDPIYVIAKEKNIPVIEDAAQAHGTTYKGKKIGSEGQFVCFSFYPSKNLGALGDGGAIATNNRETAEKLKMLRNYGQFQRYYHSLKGVNSRLDEIQAAILSAKLKYLDQWNRRRRRIAQMYSENLQNPRVQLPSEMQYGEHVYHLYVVRVKQRTKFRDYLSSHNIGTEIHYPIPVHLQKAYDDTGYTLGDFPATEQVCNEVVSLPMYPELTDEEVMHICHVINSYL
ncbi:MAG: DegT/DnrJ/EryC1/StrS family aminotransferase [Bacteroidota bacterium]